MPAFDIADVFTSSGVFALGQVILIDLMLAGDNVVVLGTLAAGLPPEQRKRVLAIGVAVALVCLIGFALVATQLLHIVGLLLGGGLLLLWVAWKLFRELRGQHGGFAPEAPDAPKRPPRTFAHAALQVALADLSMSLDNVLAVAGAARDHPAVLLFGLALSVTLMALAANVIARFIERRPWLAYIGLVVIVYVAGTMVWHGVTDPEIGVGHLFG